MRWLTHFLRPLLMTAVMAGAAGYLLKDAPAEAIADGIRDAIAGRLDGFGEKQQERP